MTIKDLYGCIIIVLQLNHIFATLVSSTRTHTHIVYTGINHVTTILLVVWARFGFTVGLAELSYISNRFSRYKAENLCAVELVKLVRRLVRSQTCWMPVHEQDTEPQIPCSWCCMCIDGYFPKF